MIKAAEKASRSIAIQIRKMNGCFAVAKNEKKKGKSADAAARCKGRDCQLRGNAVAYSSASLLY